MAIMPAILVNATNGKACQISAYLDGGAETTTITNEVSDKLGLNPLEKFDMVTGRFGDSSLIETPGKIVQFVFQGPTGYHMVMAAVSVKSICPVMTTKAVKLSPEISRLIDRYQVVNKPATQNQKTKIDLLIGQDYYNLIMHSPQFQVVCLEGSLRIHQTPFGSILSGTPNQKADISKKKLRVLTRMLFQTTSVDVRKMGQQDAMGTNHNCAVESFPTSDFWSLESIGIKESPEGSEVSVSSVNKFFSDSVSRSDDGRYLVRLPFKKNPEIPTNFNVALKRLQSILLKLCPEQVETQLLKQYNDIFQNQLKRGIIEAVPRSETPGGMVHYLPHFPVIKETSETTKVRIVMDPSTKTKNGKCLNDLLQVGSNLMEDLTGLLLRFRFPKFVLISDIEKAFLMVGLHPEDRNAVRFLWLKNPSNPTLKDNLQVLRYSRVPFGLVSSPFLLMATLDHHMQTNPCWISNKLRNQIYMDNAIIGAESREECLKIYKESKEFFRDAQMNLREWQRNCPEFQSNIPSEDCVKSQQVKVLGISWETNEDILHLQSITLSETTGCSKRILLHGVAKVFDPLGLFSPITIRGRLLIQELWKQGKDWDTQLDWDTQRQWKVLIKDLQDLPSVSVPRRIIQDINKPVQLLVFADASPKTYGFVIYGKQGSQVNLLFAKSRVAPLKPLITVPRLELLAILIAVRAMIFVEKQMKIPVKNRVLWSDSQIAVQQLKSDKIKEAWVQRRVDEINSCKDFSLNYIPGSENPADLNTRGISLSKLQHSIWFHGPSWLQGDSNQWPEWSLQSDNCKEKDETEVQIVVNVIDSMSTKNQKEEQLPTLPTTCFDLDPAQFSSLNKLLRVTVYCQRFCKKLKGQMSNNGPLNAAEIAQARLMWILQIQRAHFQETLTKLKVGKFNQFSKQLDLFLDQSGVVRVGGRLANAPLSFDSKFPALIPKGHPFTHLVIMDCHQKICHFKVKQTLARVKANYYIPQGLSEVKKVLRTCLVCQKVEGKPFQIPRMGQLPVERLSQAPAWKYTALDYLGPLMIKNPGKDSPYKKRWVALFTCFTSRAIHLEIVEDCSTDATIRAVERFIARRGTPKLILSDNQSSFLSAAKRLKSIWDNKFKDGENFAVFFAQEGIQWSTIPEKSPWYNGLTERLVSLVKRAIKKVVWRACLTEEELQTLIVKIEGILNTRPLLSTNSDFGDGAILTPAHFIAPGSQLGLPPQDEDINDPDWVPNRVKRDLLQTYKKNQKRLESFWKIYFSQYFQELKETHRLKFKSTPGEVKREPVIGEVCLVHEAGPRLHWPLARIEELYTSGDGETRYVKVKLPSGVITRRGVKDLIPLEIELNSDVQQSKKQLLSFVKRKPDYIFGSNSIEKQILESFGEAS